MYASLCSALVPNRCNSIAPLALIQQYIKAIFLDIFDLNKYLNTGHLSHSIKEEQQDGAGGGEEEDENLGKAYFSESFELSIYRHFEYPKGCN